MLSEEKGEYQHPLQSNLTDIPKFTSKEKSGDYSPYSYSRIASIQHILKAGESVPSCSKRKIPSGNLIQSG